MEKRIQGKDRKNFFQLFIVKKATDPTGQSKKGEANEKSDEEQDDCRSIYECLDLTTILEPGDKEGDTLIDSQEGQGRQGHNDQPGLLKGPKIDLCEYPGQDNACHEEKDIRDQPSNEYDDDLFRELHESSTVVRDERFP